MHFYVGVKLIFCITIGFAKPEMPASLKVAKKHKSVKVTRAHKNARAYRRATIDTAISTGCTNPDELVNFAKSLKGIRYRYGSTNPEKGFDCSGFVNYVFHHFGIGIPRSSGDFAGAYGKVDLKDAKSGDLILFTGTKRGSRQAGHIGIIVSQPGEPVMFIHSTSGAANGVTETPLNDYYMGRFIKTIRIFQESEDNEADTEELETSAR